MSPVGGSRDGGSRGGQHGHEPASRIQSRELRVIARTEQGWSQRQIAAELEISQPAVSKILHRVEDRVSQDVPAAVERQKVRQTLRLEHLYTESVRAWEQSKADTTRRRQRKTTGPDQAGTTVAELVTEHQHGDPRFLEQSRRVLADLRALWGLDAPQKVDVRATRNPYAELSEDALREELGRQTRLLAAAGPVAAATQHEERPDDDADRS